MMGKDESLITLVDERPGQVFRHTGNAQKIRSMFDWKQEVGWDEGLKKTIDWYKENRVWWNEQLWMRAVPIITKSGKKELH
jgi:dTDP-glucose 4,6-dehydratase